MKERQQTAPSSLSSGQPKGMPKPPPEKPTVGSGPRSTSKELDASEVVLMAVKHFKGHLADAKEITKISPKSFENMKMKLANRLTPELIRAYSVYYSGESSLTRGMQILEQLQAAMKEMDLVAPIIPLLANSAEQPRDADALTAALQQARAAGVEVHARVDELVSVSVLDEMLKENKWSSYAAAVGSLHEKVGTLSGARAAEMSKTHVVTAIVEMCKSDGQDIELAHTNIKSMVEAVYQTIAKDKERHAPLYDELQHLRAFMASHDEMDDEAYNQAERGRDHLTKTRQSMFFKSLTMLPTGKVNQCQIALFWVP
jgi:hypothetical protein